MLASTPLSEAFTRFGDSLRAAKKSFHTVDAYRRDLEAIAELLVDPLNKTVGEILLTDVTVTALQHAFAVRADTSAAATVARTHSAWTRFHGTGAEALGRLAGIPSMRFASQNSQSPPRGTARCNCVRVVALRQHLRHRPYERSRRASITGAVHQ